MVGVPSFDLQGRIAVVTGGASGMGAASCAALAHFGARVAVLDRDGDAAATLAGKIGAAGYACDISDEAQVAACLDRIRSDLGPITILHNNAAIHLGYGGGDEPAGTMQFEAWRRTMAVNLDGTFLVTKYALADMVAAKRGSIINTASLAGPLLGSQNTAYTAAKGGVVGLTRALVITYAGTGIRANAILPGFVATPMSQPVLTNPLDLERYASQVPVGRNGEPEDIGGLVVFLASEASAYVNGAVITLDGGVSLR